ncbi:cytochrome c5 family protein [Vibrio sp. SS-MA-C1-2]|uniref:c-type cytochrome n=1 Tax=Vibrio sp. SS-MA-C1-2 TaxID=2908646 RepID=UPI001F2DAFA1|nr:cytochrome c5 family protein [Vibrio sp. SS-MA-C1-2]UJF19382.1 cytochrome c5 family protein [Vibrio sp. SS-MA-C1-2]
MEKLYRQAILLISALFIFTSQAVASDMSHDAIEQRIKPVSSVYVTSDAPAQESNVPAAPRTGEQVYNTFCVACHSTGAAGAPKMGDTAAWAPRIAQGMDTLTQHALNGFNAMPPKGTCMDCSNDEIIATIKFMTK